MNFSESLKIAIKCIKANWMRSLLTMLGIIIGITSVIMIVGAGTGVRDYIVGLIQDMGSNAVLVSVDETQATDNDYITLDDVANIKKKVKDVERCSPMLMGFGRATIDKTATEATVMMIGVNSDVQFAMTSTCEHGRFFNDEEYDANAPIAVMGIESAKSVYGYEDVTGESVTVTSSGTSMKIKVCGVANVDSLASSLGGSGGMSNMFKSSSDKPVIALFMPCTTLTQITGGESHLGSVFVIAEEGAEHHAEGDAGRAAHGGDQDDIAERCVEVEFQNVLDVQDQACHADDLDHEAGENVRGQGHSSGHRCAFVPLANLRVIGHGFIEDTRADPGGEETRHGDQGEKVMHIWRELTSPVVGIPQTDIR